MRVIYDPLLWDRTRPLFKFQVRLMKVIQNRSQCSRSPGLRTLSLVFIKLTSIKSLFWIWQASRLLTAPGACSGVIGIDSWSFPNRSSWIITTRGKFTSSADVCLKEPFDNGVGLTRSLLASWRMCLSEDESVNT